MEDGVLPDHWKCSQLSDMSIAVYHFSSAQPTNVSYMLKICPDHSWTLLVGLKQVVVQQSQLLQGIPGLLHTVDDIVSIVTLVSGSKFCAGNPDDKFKNLVSHYNGKFMDHHGI